MSGKRRTPKDWRRHVYRSREVSSAVKVYLVYLSEHMKADLSVSRPRHLVAADLGVSERTVNRLTADAHEADFLMTLVRGQKGTTAVYRGMFGGLQRDTSCPPEIPVQGDIHLDPESPQIVPLKPRSAGQHVGPPVVTTDEQCAACHGWGCERCA